jgi:hypothetical protein
VLTDDKTIAPVPMHCSLLSALSIAGAERNFPLRDRLLALRVDVLRQLAESEAIDGGLLALLGNVGAAITAIDAASPVAADAEPNARAVVSDDGTEIRLTLYAENGAVFAVPIAPGRAVALAGELIAAARPKLPR